MQENRFKELLKLSRHYGSDSNMIQAGGGNTSLKADDLIWVKASGISLKDVTGKESFVSMNLNKVNSVLNNETMLQMPEKERDNEVNRLLGEAQTESTSRKPSIETFLHALMEGNLVAHTHPVYVNAMVCSSNGRNIASELFEKSKYIWLDYHKPGYPLGYALSGGIKEHFREFHNTPGVVFLQNHGLIISGKDFEDINMQTEKVVSDLRSYFSEIDDPPVPVHKAGEQLELLMLISGVLDGIEPDIEHKSFLSRCPYVNMMSSIDFFSDIPLTGSLYPDHIVYCGEMPLMLESGFDGDIKERVNQFINKIGYMPRYVIMSGIGVLILGKNDQELSVREELLRTHVKTLMLIQRRGTPVFMAENECKYIAHWEAEKYRQKIAQ